MQQPYPMPIYPRPNVGTPPTVPLMPTPFMAPPMPTPQIQPMQPQPFPGAQVVPPMPSGQLIPGTLTPTTTLFIEQSYIENVLRANLGKKITAFMSFDEEQQSFTGVLMAAARDHFIIADPVTGKRYLLLMVYLDYITSDEELNYINIPFPEQVQPQPPTGR